MNTSKSFPFSPLFFFLLCFFNLSSSLLACNPSSCNHKEPYIRFPFYIKDQQNDNCGYPGFEISCNHQRQTIISFPYSGDFLVSRIDYASQTIYLNDPDYCLPQKIVNFYIKSTPFSIPSGKHFTFFNCSCSSNDCVSYLTNRIVPLPCLQNNNYMFLGTVFELAPDELPPSCVEIMNVTVPLKLSLAQYSSSTVLSEDIQLIWEEPNCKACEAQEMYCGFDKGMGFACFRPTKIGFPWIAKYAVGFGAGLPLLACVIGAGYFFFDKIKNLALRNNTSSHPVISSTASGGGLDSLTINSYPKTIFGESRCLPKINDITCPICLCEYQANETLRNIPECNHYFHVTCIDEWLKINSTCPVCRNTLQHMTAPPPPPPLPP